nr:hypothetical protein [Pedobacter panaciterrae]
METSEIAWLNTNKTYKKCPYCKHGDLDSRIRRGTLVKSFLFWLDLKRYACGSCGRKVYMVGKNQK